MSVLCEMPDSQCCVHRQSPPFPHVASLHPVVQKVATEFLEASDRRYGLAMTYMTNKSMYVSIRERYHHTGVKIGVQKGVKRMPFNSWRYLLWKTDKQMLYG